MAELMTLATWTNDDSARRLDARAAALAYMRTLDERLDRLDDKISLGESLCRAWYVGAERLAAEVHKDLHGLRLERDRLIRTRAALAREHELTAEEVGCE